MLRFDWGLCSPDWLVAVSVYATLRDADQDANISVTDQDSERYRAIPVNKQSRRGPALCTVHGRPLTKRVAGEDVGGHGAADWSADPPALHVRTPRTGLLTEQPVSHTASGATGSPRQER